MTTHTRRIVLAIAIAAAVVGASAHGATHSRRTNNPILAAADLNRQRHGLRTAPSSPLPVLHSSQRRGRLHGSVPFFGSSWDVDGDSTMPTGMPLLTTRGGGPPSPHSSKGSGSVVNASGNGNNVNVNDPMIRGGSTKTMTPSAYKKAEAALAANSATASAVSSAKTQSPHNIESNAIDAVIDTAVSATASASMPTSAMHPASKSKAQASSSLSLTGMPHKAIAKKLKNRNHTNLRRKLLHATFGVFFCGLNHLIPKAKFVPGMTILTSATLIMELLRYRKGFGWMNSILHFILGSSLRKHEMDGKFTGSFYYFLGVTTTAALYPKSCATLGILQLAIADPTASYFGRKTRHIYWSRIENGLGGIGRNKGMLGFLGGALACVPFNYRLLSLAKFSAEKAGVATALIPGGRQALLLASVALGMAGAFADLAVPTPTLTLPKRVCGIRVPPFHVDDNFVVPVVSGYACTKIFAALGWPATLELAPFMWL